MEFLIKFTEIIFLYLVIFGFLWDDLINSEFTEMQDLSKEE